MLETPSVKLMLSAQNSNSVKLMIIMVDDQKVSSTVTAHLVPTAYQSSISSRTPLQSQQHYGVFKCRVKAMYLVTTYDMAGSR